MSGIYLPKKNTELREDLSALVLGGLCVVAAFALLPLITTFPKLFAPPPISPPIITPEPIPDFMVTEPPPIIEKDPLEKPELVEPPPLVTIEIMEMMINATASGVTVTVDSGASFLDDDATSTNLFLLDDLDARPRVIVAVQPIYPYDQQQAKSEGNVLIQFIIDEQGRVLRPRVLRSSHRAFEQAALDAIRKSKWQPGQKAGKNVRTLVRQPVNFQP